MKLTLTGLVMALFVTFGLHAQQNGKTGPSYIGAADSHTYVPSLESRMDQLRPSITKEAIAQDARAHHRKLEIIPGKGRQADFFSKNRHPMEGQVPGRAPDLVWDAAFSNSQPTDPALAVGPNHVFVVFNTGYAIYDKDGNTLLGQTAPSPSIFPSNGCCDLTVSYDPVATSVGNPTPGRWVLSFLGGGAQVAVSDGPNPLTAGWNVYTIATINDYNKLSVWSDGYYISDQANGNRIYAMERQAMLDGEPAANVSIQGFTPPNFSNQGFASLQILNISDDQYPAAGNATAVFYQDDAYTGVTQDHIKFWDIDVDFDTPGNSTISTPQEENVTPFTSIFDGTAFNNLTQPGGQDIDALQGIIMNQAQYKKMPGYNMCVFTFVIDIGGGTEQAALRWYEFRQTADGAPWTMHQEGTLSAADGTHYWHGSMMIDTQGNIGMGFTAMGNNTTGNGPNQFVSSYYTGRLATDPLGTMTITPQLIAAGAANIPGSERYGDYGKCDIDPSDYKRMYFINEYMSATGPARADVVGRFQIAPNFTTDVGVIDVTAPIDGTLTSTESVTITLRNFGAGSVSNIPVSFDVDGGTAVNEIFTGTIGPGLTASHTFATNADLSIEGQTYAINATTNLAGDEDTSNDPYSENVTHIFANDIGVTAIIGPMSGTGLANESIAITIENFGAVSQSNFNVSYSIDGATPVVENVAGPLAPGASIPFTFATQGDFSTLATYNLVATSALGSDAVASNNSTIAQVIHFSCSNDQDTTSQPVGPNGGTVTTSLMTVTNDIQVSDVNVTVNIDHTWVGDLTIDLIHPDTSTVVNLFDQTGDGDDDFVNTTFDDQATTPVTSGTAPFTGSFQPTGSLSDFNGLGSLGDWTLRITDNVNGDGGTLNDWTLELCGNSLLGVDDMTLNNGDLVVVYNGNDQFDVSLPTTEIQDPLILTVTNMLGQRVFNYSLSNETGQGYNYKLNMSYMATGVYLVRLGNSNYASVKRIVVE
jgi:subtilisin-like proprotein convertase family protein